MKKCSKCGIEKELSEFYYGHGKCKACFKITNKLYNTINKKSISEQKKTSYRKNKDAKKQYAQQYRELNKVKISIKGKLYYQDNKETINERNKSYTWCPEKQKQSHKKYYDKNKHEILTKTKFRNKQRLKTDIQYRLTQNLRCRIWHALNGRTKSAKTLDLLGCSIDFLKTHLSKQFTEGMTLENYGTWHIDHIIPCAKFELTIPEQQRLCFNYRNLQPLWAKDNLSKGAKYN